MSVQNCGVLDIYSSKTCVSVKMDISDILEHFNCFLHNQHTTTVDRRDAPTQQLRSLKMAWCRAETLRRPVIYMCIDLVLWAFLFVVFKACGLEIIRDAKRLSKLPDVKHFWNFCILILSWTYLHPVIGAGSETCVLISLNVFVVLTFSYLIMSCFHLRLNIGILQPLS